MELNIAFHFKGQITPGSTVILLPVKSFKLSEQFNVFSTESPKYENSRCPEQNAHPGDQVCDSHVDGPLVLMRDDDNIY